MSDLSKALGIGSRITFEDKDYEVAPETYEMIAELQEYLEDRLRSKIRRLKGKIPEDSYIEQMDAMTRLIASEAMGPGTPEFDKALQTIEVRIRRMWRRLWENNRDVKLDLVQRMFIQHWQELERLAAEADKDTGKDSNDPNPKAATETTGV